MDIEDQLLLMDINGSGDAKRGSPQLLQESSTEKLVLYERGEEIMNMMPEEKSKDVQQQQH